MDTKNITQEKLSKDFSWSDIQLRSYQLEGVNWLLDCYNKNHGCILGDEMGLGKTCQTIALLSVTSAMVDNRPHLVVCPRSLLENWEKEFERFSPNLKVKVYIGDKEHRAELAKELKKSRNNSSFDVVVTTYEMCLKDNLFYQSMRWNVLVVDEAHRLKNHESLLYTTLEGWDIKTKVLLTGTPVQNNLRELYSLLSFIDGKTFRLSKIDRFIEKYSDETQDIQELLELMEPYLLRRTKAQVVLDLPEKTDIILYHGLSALQKKLYKAILTKDIGAFETNFGPTRTRLMNILMQLRKCVNHPYLFDGVEEEPFELGEHLVEASSKLCLIDKLLENLHQAGHKVLMFSQMSRMLDVLQDYLGYRGYSYERLDGSVRGEERFLAVQSFNQNEDTFVFLLSTKAGGQGLNLTSADTVIFVDSDFNPQNDLQAAARAHRIGQDRPVKIIRLIGQYTVEEIILKRAEEKLRLTEKVIESGHFASSSKKPKVLGGETGGQLQEILKFGVDELLSETKSDETVDFEDILGRSEEGRWVVDDGSKTEQSENSLSMQEPTKSMEVEGTPSQSMYVFEGTDYSKEPSAADLKAFEQLLSEETINNEVAGEKTLRRAGTSVTGLKPRKQLTAEQLEERRVKMKEAAERKAKLAEEKKAQRLEKLRQKKEKFWQENNYTSANIILASDGEEEEEDEALSVSDNDEDVDDEEEDTKESGKGSEPKGHLRKKLPINYAIGDVTKPQQVPDHDNFVIHCVDDSGSWGRGGVFTALSSCGRDVQDGYETAGRMDDLNLGDCHIVQVSDARSDEENKFWVALLVAQHRDKRNQLSGIDLTALQLGLRKVYQAAKEKHASVHLPRIGHDTPKFNWYATERLIRKHLASRGIPTYIYYFPRRAAAKRKNVARPTAPPTKAPKTDDNSSTAVSPVHSNIVTSSLTSSLSSSSSSSSSSTPKDALTDLSSFLSGVAVLFHNLTSDQERKLTRYVMAFDGDVHKAISETTTHIVTTEDTEKQALSTLAKDTDCPVVSTKWLELCVSKQCFLPCEDYVVSLV